MNYLPLILMPQQLLPLSQNRHLLIINFTHQLLKFTILMLRLTQLRHPLPLQFLIIKSTKIPHLMQARPPTMLCPPRISGLRRLTRTICKRNRPVLLQQCPSLICPQSRTFQRSPIRPVARGKGAGLHIVRKIDTFDWNLPLYR